MVNGGLGDLGFFKNLIASDDLNPADFFLLRYLKERVYSDPVPKTTDQLKNNIRREVKKIEMDTIRAAIDNMLPRIQNMISRKGAWFEKFLKY
jgi:hypothetical protein